MQFTHTWQQILNGQKTQTRRLIGDDEFLLTPTLVAIGCEGDGCEMRFKWQVSKTYAVQPGRAKRAIWWRRLAGLLQTTGDAGCPESVRKYNRAMFRHDGWIEARIKITAIRRERLRDITESDAIAEGVNLENAPAMLNARDGFSHLWNTVHPKAPDNWESNPAVWVLTFELVRD